MERLGFCLKWRLWIKNLLQVNSVSILVNGSPTKEFSMAKGLRQGDPLAPFLFLIVAESLSGIIRMAVTKNIYFGYMVGKDAMAISQLQYTDDTLLIGENSEHNIMAVDKLYCAIASIPFNFLGIPVGANPKRLSTWSPIIDSFQKKLSLWKHKLISFGGRVTLLKLGALDKEATVISLGAWNNGVWSWILRWRRNLFSWEMKNLEELLRQLHGIVPKQHSDDSWNWIHDTNGKYSVRNAYQTLQKVDGSCGLAFFKRLWACNAPAKMKFLVW
ncbi:PREDICTED: uncharacterized protein LOC109337026 [Lupinus angustifolius]|uniref:uncharacterized protein LOC109337026 n=1 Tax=Lupinus angustifolius TaxID=3871 RepID=UPI00092F2811|nr:PREDICTED: uncharacterized protein LOC109337026 [Lupinus angustifolius]